MDSLITLCSKGSLLGSVTLKSSVLRFLLWRATRKGQSVARPCSAVETARNTRCLCFLNSLFFLRILYILECKEQVLFCEIPRGPCLVESCQTPRTFVSIPFMYAMGDLDFTSMPIMLRLLLVVVHFISV